MGGDADKFVKRGWAAEKLRKLLPNILFSLRDKVSKKAGEVLELLLCG